MNKHIVITAVLMLAVGAGGGYWLAMQNKQQSEIVSTEAKMPLFYRNQMNPSDTSPVPAKDNMGMDYVPVYVEDEKPEKSKVLFYRNPMNPSVTSPVPTKDNMGMDYLPVYAEDVQKNGPPGTITINPVTLQNLGISTALAEQRTLARTIRTVGRVTYDEQLLTRLHPKIEGWITKLYVDETGEQVKRNQELLEIYSPQLVTTEEEYLLALNGLEELKNSPYKDVRQSADNLVKSTRERLAWLDVPAHQISTLEATRKAEKNLHIHSPFNGSVVNIGAREGVYVTPQTELYMIADLSHIWILADIYEYELPFIRVGQEAKVTLSYDPKTVLTARITFIYPNLDPKTRTAKVRFELDNPGQKLKLDMYTNVELQIPLGMRLVVPEGAILNSGTRNILFVDHSQGHLEPRDVQIGVNADGYYEVLKGVTSGERVVTSAAFLIDSESQLQSALGMMGMPGMEMEKKRTDSMPSILPVPEQKPSETKPAMKMPGMPQETVQ
ncbi:efflux RND transporter periplasmic adaptor subunit [Methylobacter sp.]|uniref:efflux RND transporter periplasmic adaptor subunit n=1 Tax=Methylobacter sp. TaxID=2051955 RepID=UPI002FDDADE7